VDMGSILMFKNVVHLVIRVERVKEIAIKTLNVWEVLCVEGTIATNRPSHHAILIAVKKVNCYFRYQKQEKHATTINIFSPPATTTTTKKRKPVRINQHIEQPAVKYCKVLIVLSIICCTTYKIYFSHLCFLTNPVM